MFFLYFLAFNLALSLIIGVNLYLAFKPLITNKVVYWIILILFTQSYVLVRFAGRQLDLHLPAVPFFIISSILGLCVLAVVVAAGFDVLLLLSYIIKPLNPLFQLITSNPVKTGIIALAIVFGEFISGFYIAHTPRETFYNLELSKPLAVEKLTVVQISDLHIASFTTKGWIEKLADKVNALNPDLVLFTGDIVDGEVYSYIEKDAPAIFSRIKSKYGVYAVLGNHEYYSDNIEAAVKAFENSGMTVLIDDKKYIEPLGITVIGRDDYSSAGFGRHRKSLNELLENVDTQKPFIVMDHQPHNSVIDEGIANKVDLQFSGHTHNGQFFPGNLVVKKAYRTPWKFLKDGGYNLIVSCGVGTWGPPLRTGSYSEIVVAEIRGQ